MMALTINEIKLKNFRNYSHLVLSQLGSLVIIVGPNAIGKTNIIEAIQLTTSFVSSRNASINQLIKWKNSQATIETHIKDSQRDLKIDLTLEEEKKNYYLNGKKKRSKELKGILPSVSFFPDDLSLIKGSQSIKRKNLDTFGSQASQNFQTVKKDYEKTLQHKNYLLKEDTFVPNTVIDALNETLITTGIQFYLYRKALLEKLIPSIKKHYEIISYNKEKLNIKYCSSWCEDEEETNKEILNEKFKIALQQKADEEKRRGYALVGPHTDKIMYEINSQDAVVYASQGQQRSLVLSTKLAEVEILQEITGQKPILLLDDVMSELDKDRRETLLNFIKNDIQTFITTTHLEYFSENVLKHAHIIDLNSPLFT